MSESLLSYHIMAIHLICQNFYFPDLDILSTLRNIWHPVTDLTLLFKTARFWGREGKGREQGGFRCNDMYSSKDVCVYVYLYFTQRRKE